MALLLPFLALVTGCSETVVTTVDVEQVRVNPSEAPLFIGSTIQLQAELLDNEGKAVTGVPVSWSTEDESVVEVNGDGEVTGRSAGEAIVRATADGVAGLATIHVQHTVPAAPSDLVARPVDLDDGMNVRLEWKDNSDDETSFRIERRNVTAQAEFELLTTVDPDVTSYLDETVSADATYSYRVLACSEGGCSGSDAVSITTPPLAPSDLKAVEVTEDYVELSWKNNSQGETEFQILRRRHHPPQDQFEEIDSIRTDAVNPTFRDDDVKEERTYDYMVQTCDASGQCESSNTITVTIPED